VVRQPSARKSFASAAAALLAVAVLAGCGSDDERGSASRLTLALDFMPNAVHAGVYTTKRLSLDRGRGIDLRVVAPSASTDSLKLLASGSADVAIVDIHDLGLARERGEDLVGVGAIVQRPLAAVIARGVDRPRALEGKRVGVTGLPSDDAVLRAVLEHDGGSYDRVRRVTIGFSAVPSLISEKVDAATAFWNAEGVTLRDRGVRTREFRVGDYGAPPYPELVLVVKRETLERRRDDLEKLLSALAAGTSAALRDRPASVREIARVSGAPGPLVRAQLDAVAPALRPPLRLDRRALEAWAAFDQRFGILERRPDIERSFDFSLGPSD
jgi:putative hydroxymethylpyrimidine transport system substrate-binding protein